MINEQENEQIVRGIYDAFGRGDAPGLLKHLSNEVDWEIMGPASVPFYGPRLGLEGAGEFLTQIGTSVEFEKFEVLEFMSAGDKVIVLGRERGRVRATGKSFDNEWAMIYTVRDGKVIKLRCYENTAAVADAFKQ
jgi:ketosteroid isomerase-like protein